MENKKTNNGTESPYKAEPAPKILKTVDISDIPFCLDLSLPGIDIVIGETRYIGSANLKLDINNEDSLDVFSSPDIPNYDEKGEGGHE